MKKVLICEDETIISDFLTLNLQKSGYEVAVAASGEAALKIFEAQRGNFDVALLDVMLAPGGINGFTVCKKIREKNPTIGIIMLSAKGEEQDKLTGLMYGADDYIVKPYSIAELTARVDAIYRRVSMLKGAVAEQAQEIVSGPFTLDTKSRTVKKNGEEIELTPTEYSLIEYFMKNPGLALDRNTILNNIWDNYYGDFKIVDINIRRIRVKIEDDPSDPKYLTTVRGFGYRWNIEE